MAPLRIERRHLVTTVTNHRDAVRLQPFTRRRQIQNNLRAGANDNDRSTRELRQIRGNVGQRSSMHAADTTRRENPNPYVVSDPDRRSYGCRAIPAERHRQWQIARAQLLYVVVARQYAQLVFSNADTAFSLDHSNRRGNCVL